MTEQNNLARLHEEKIGCAGLTELLSKADMNDVVPILAEVFQNKAKMVTPSSLLWEAEKRQELYAPSAISQRELCEFQQLYYQILPKDWDTVELPPIMPLGVCAGMTGLGQNQRLSTIRAAEVISDSTLAMAIVAALRRKEYMKREDTMFDTVSLSTFHRLLRLQKFDADKPWKQHFEILGTLTAGRQPGKNNFVHDTIFRHVRMWIQFMHKLNTDKYCYRNLLFTFSSIPLMEWILDHWNVSPQLVRSNSLHSSFRYFKECGIPLPTRVDSCRELEESLLSDPAGRRVYKALCRFEEMVLLPLRAEFPEVAFQYEVDRKLGFGYFSGICFHGFAENVAGVRFDLIDGGSSDWAAKLLSDKKELMVSSSFGVEVGITQFRK